MAKNFPFFKFVATEWLTGDIVYESLEVQGLYINICALYWQRDGVVSILDLEKRYKRPDLIAELSGRLFSVEEGYISIEFLDEQLEQIDKLSKVNSENGKKGAKIKASLRAESVAVATNSLSDTSANLSNKDKNKNKNKNKTENKNKSMESRKLKFSETLAPYLEKYGKDILNDFYKYWTEPNKSGTKFRQELESTWSLERRLETWASRDRNFSKLQAGKSKTENLVNVSTTVKNLFENEQE